jgi:hypothetical protein
MTAASIADNELFESAPAKASNSPTVEASRGFSLRVGSSSAAAFQSE